MVCSLTRTAAAEVAGRDLPLSKDAIGTLHSHAYRALGRGKIEIADDPAHLSEWNEAHPNMALSAGRILDEDNAAPGGGPTDADAAYADYNNQRARMINRENWRISTLAFAKVWEHWKGEQLLTDFTDLLELALGRADTAPNSPGAIFADECVAGETIISFADGRRIPIREVVEQRISGLVWSYSHANEQLEAKPIIGWHKTPRRGRQIISIGDCHVTADHPVFTQEFGYLAIGEVLQYNQDITILRLADENIQSRRLFDSNGDDNYCGRYHGRFQHSAQPWPKRECTYYIPAGMEAVSLSGMESPTAPTMDSFADSRPSIHPIWRSSILRFHGIPSSVHPIAFHNRAQRPAPSSGFTVSNRLRIGGVVYGRRQYDTK